MFYITRSADYQRQFDFIVKLYENPPSHLRTGKNNIQVVVIRGQDPYKVQIRFCLCPRDGIGNITVTNDLRQSYVINVYVTYTSHVCTE